MLSYKFPYLVLIISIFMRSGKFLEDLMQLKETDAMTLKSGEII